MLTRRTLMMGTFAVAAVPAFAQTRPQGQVPNQGQGIDAVQFGLRPNAVDDQTRQLQRAFDDAAQRNTPLWLAPGLYRSGELILPAGLQLFGVRGATRIALTGGASLLSAQGVSDVTLSGLSLEGGNRKLPGNSGLMTFSAVTKLRVENCAIVKSGSNGISLYQCSGEIATNNVSDSAEAALFCNDSTMTIRGNSISKSGNGGILVWQSAKRHDGSLIEGNTIEDTAARGGGDGQNGNAINIYRAAGVTVRGNIIRRAAFTAVRGNAASHIIIRGNQCFDIGEVAIYSEFDFEDATIIDNIVDTAAMGIAVTNMDKGGHLAMVRGNVIRNMTNKRPQGGPDAYGVGIGVEADTTVSGNTIENAPNMGIVVGAGKYLRDCKVTNNIVRDAGIGIGVSVVDGAGAAAITSNVISNVRRGAVVGMAWDKPATGDLTRGGAEKYPQLTVADNKVS